jgi:hypothetical protein
MKKITFSILILLIAGTGYDCLKKENKPEENFVDGELKEPRVADRPYTTSLSQATKHSS